MKPNSQNPPIPPSDSIASPLCSQCGETAIQDLYLNDNDLVGIPVCESCCEKILIARYPSSVQAKVKPL